MSGDDDRNKESNVLNLIALCVEGNSQLVSPYRDVITLSSLFLSYVFAKYLPDDRTTFRERLSLPPPQEMALQESSMG